MLYKRADHQNPKWTVRLKVPEVSGFVVKSTKTTDDFEARRFAEDLYYRLEGKARRGEPINSPTFRRVFSEWAKVPVAASGVMPARTPHHFAGCHGAVAPGQKPLTVSPRRAAVTKPPGLESLTTSKPDDLQEFPGG